MSIFNHSYLSFPFPYLQTSAVMDVMNKPLLLQLPLRNLPLQVCIHQVVPPPKTQLYTDFHLVISLPVFNYSYSSFPSLPADKRSDGRDEQAIATSASSLESPTTGMYTSSSSPPPPGKHKYTDFYLLFNYKLVNF